MHIRASRLLRVLLIVSTSALCGIGSPALAAQDQASGTIAGSVTNSDGKPVAGAIVTLARNGATFSAPTAADGRYSIDVVPGTYVIDVFAKGFASPGAREVSAAADQTAVVDVQLAQSTSSLTTIGRVITRAGDALSTSSAPSTQVDARTYAARGASSLIDVLAGAAAPLTMIRPAGGNPAAPAAIALRGPDPTETLFDVDGHALNSGGSGSFDASLLDPAQLESVQLVYGIAPSSLVGPNTIGGAVNVRTLDPTAQPHSLYRFTIGSYDAFGETLTATGAGGTVGYAASVHRQTEQGETSQSILTTDGASPTVGSAIDSSSALAKMRFTFGGGGLAELSVRDQSAFRDLSAALSSIVPGQPTRFNDFSGSASLAHNAGYALDVQLPLGLAIAGSPAPSILQFRHLTSIADQSVVGPAQGTNPFLNDERDAIDDEIIELDRSFADQTLSFKIDLRSEGLATTITPGGVQDQSIVHHDAGAPTSPTAGIIRLDQVQRSVAARYTIDTPAELHYALAVYASDFSSFGSSVDPRFSVVWTPTAQTSLRGSVGATFQTPQLPELYVPPVLPPPDANGIFHIGNPHLSADRATDYDIGVDHLFTPGGSSTHLTVDWYRSDVRNTSILFVPAIDCNPSHGPPPPPQRCESFPVNIGHATYQGLELAVERQLSRAAHLRGSYDVNSSFPIDIPSAFSAGTIVDGEQFLGVPLHAAAIDLSVSPSPTFEYETGIHYEGTYNELNRAPFMTLQAGATLHAGQVDVGLYGTNLTGVYDDRFTLAGQGVPYGGIDGTIPTDAFSLQGPAVTLVVTLHG
jgi:outer membrane receptor protein involved in Fe transport